jgi:hypothetical protein
VFRPWVITLLAAGLGLAGGVARTARAADPPPREGVVRYVDPRLDSRPPERSWNAYPVRMPAAVRDPKSNLPYPRLVRVQCRTGEDAPVRFAVHYLEPADEALALRVGGLLGRLYWLGQDYLGVAPGRSAARPAPLDVWLARSGRAGGEEYQGNIYLFDVAAPRAPAEWVREVAHEYSHVVLPLIGKYTAPEPWASGYLGERLFLKWLLADNGMTDVWDEPIDGAAYVAHQVAPPRTRFLEEGPASLTLERRDQEGMEFAIGQVLAIEATYGPKILRPLFAALNDPNPEKLGATLAAVLPGTGTALFSLDGRLSIPSRTEPGPRPGELKRAAYWLCLPQGEWRLRLAGTVPPGTTAAVDGRTLERAPETPSVPEWRIRPGPLGATWRRLEVSCPEGGMRLNRVELSR